MALLQDSVIARYKMNDNLATDVIIDETGNHNGAVKDATGTATSAFHSVTGKINLAQEFDGTDDYIEIPDHDDFSPIGTPFSISAWVYMHSATNFTIASKGIYSVDAEWWFRIRSDISNNLEFIYCDNSANATKGRSIAIDFSTYENQWIHLVATYDGGILTSSVKIYLNGVQADDTDRQSGPFTAVENLTRAVWIGRYSSVYSDGLVDNVAFFNKELTPLEISLLYNAGAGVEDIPIGIHLSRTGQQFASSQMN